MSRLNAEHRSASAALPRSAVLHHDVLSALPQWQEFAHAVLSHCVYQHHGIAAIRDLTIRGDMATADFTFNDGYSPSDFAIDFLSFSALTGMSIAVRREGAGPAVVFRSEATISAGRVSIQVPRGFQDRYGLEDPREGLRFVDALAHVLERTGRSSEFNSINIETAIRDAVSSTPLRTQIEGIHHRESGIRIDTDTLIEHSGKKWFGDACKSLSDISAELGVPITIALGGLRNRTVIDVIEPITTISKGSEEVAATSLYEFLEETVQDALPRDRGKHVTVLLPSPISFETMQLLRKELPFFGKRIVLIEDRDRVSDEDDVTRDSELQSALQKHTHHARLFLSGLSNQEGIVKTTYTEALKKLRGIYTNNFRWKTWQDEVPPPSKMSPLLDDALIAVGNPGSVQEDATSVIRLPDRYVWTQFNVFSSVAAAPGSLLDLHMRRGGETLYDLPDEEILHIIPRNIAISSISLNTRNPRPGVRLRREYSLSGEPLGPAEMSLGHATISAALTVAEVETAARTAGHPFHEASKHLIELGEMLYQRHLADGLFAIGENSKIVSAFQVESNDLWTEYAIGCDLPVVFRAIRSPTSVEKDKVIRKIKDNFELTRAEEEKLSRESEAASPAEFRQLLASLGPSSEIEFWKIVGTGLGDPYYTTDKRNTHFLMGNVPYAGFTGGARRYVNMVNMEQLRRSIVGEPIHPLEYMTRTALDINAVRSDIKIIRDILRASTTSGEVQGNLLLENGTPFILIPSSGVRCYLPSASSRDRGRFLKARVIGFNVKAGKVIGELI